MSQSTPQTTAFDFGGVVNRTFTSVSGNWRAFLLTAIVFAGVPSFVTALSTFFTASGRIEVGTVANIVGTLLSVVGGYVLQGAVVYAAVSGFGGRKVGARQAFSVGARATLPLFGLAILMSLGLFVGFIFFIVPGLILAVVWMVAAPALVMEKRGVFDSFQRSRDLTRGHRWPIFGLMVAWLVFFLLVSMAFGALFMIGGAGLSTEINAMLIVSLIAEPLLSIVIGVVTSAGVASIYYELRRIKEGAGVNDIASVFD